MYVVVSCWTITDIDPDVMLQGPEGLEWFQRLVSVDISTLTYFLLKFRFNERTERQSVLL
jgi:hypothetical protein